jgi:hypothetical protein
MNEVYIKKHGSQLVASATGPNAFRKAGQTWAYFVKNDVGEWKISKVESIEQRNMGYHKTIMIHEKYAKDKMGYFNDPQTQVIGTLVDPIAPKVSAGNVKNGSKYVDPKTLNQKGVVIEFSEKVSRGTAELKPEGGEVLGTEAKWEGNKVTLTLLAGRTLANETAYVITIGGVKDAVGNALQGGTIRFTTRAAEVSLPATTFTAVPAPGSEVAANATITLAFDHPVESVAGATGSGKNWNIPVAASLSITWKNQDGSDGGPVSLVYKSKAADKTAPKIRGGNVKNGAKDVDPAPLNESGITLEFSEAVDQGWAELKPEGGEVLGTEAKWEGKKVTLTLLAGKTLANETAYVITVGGVKDTAGNALEGGTVKFTTRAAEISPVVETVSVKTEAISLPADGTSTTKLTISLKDTAQQAVLGQTVTLTADIGQVSIAKDNGDGTYTATYTAGTKDGTATVTAKTANGKTATVELTLTEKETEVETTPSFSLSSLKSEQTGQAGGTLSDLVKLQAKDGFSGKVTLFATDLPDGVKVVFDPKEVTLTVEEPLQTSQMIITLGTDIKEGDYQAVVLATSETGSTQKMTVKVKVEAAGLIPTSILLTLKPKELPLNSSLEVFGRLANISETEATIPDNTELKLTLTSPVGETTEFVVNTTDDGSYQLATPYTPDEVGEWQIKAGFTGSTTLKASQRSSTFKVVKGTAVIAFDNTETAALGTELELLANLNPQLAEQRYPLKSSS